LPDGARNAARNTLSTLGRLQIERLWLFLVDDLDLSPDLVTATLYQGSERHNETELHNFFSRSAWNVFLDGCEATYD
jgi:hypothetical protein